MRLSLSLSAICLTLLAPLTAGFLNEDLSAIPEHGWEPSSTPMFKPNNKSVKKDKKSKLKNLILVDGGAVYLRPYQGGTDFAQVVPIDAAGQGSASGSQFGVNKPIDFDFSWGARAGLGFQWEHCRQTLRANYLYFQSSAHRSTEVDGTTQAILANALGVSDQIYFSSANSTWKLHFNMLDLVFGKKVVKKGCMSFEPFIGTKGILFSETQTATYSGLTPDTNTKQHVHFQGAGPVAGINLDWYITKWLSFTGSVDCALLYSSVKTTRSNPQENAFVWTGSSHDIKGTPMLDGALALRGVYCMKRGRFIDLQIGFEEHYAFHVMKHAFAVPDSDTDLSLQGWFATLGFGF